MSSPVSDREQRILGIIETARGKRAKFRDERITMAHGAGGKATRSLVEGLLAPAFGIEALDDAAAVGELALTTDAFVVKPLRFPGGSIGELAVNGTVNDLAMGGAKPLALTVSLILEEGLDAATLRAEVDAIARAATQADVRIVGGDTKVVERGHADGMYITTTGLGRRDPRAAFCAARPGDRILLSGAIAAHGTAIMLARGEFDLESDDIASDTRSLWPAVDAILGPGVRQLRDATRGGVASVLNELARDSGVAMLIQEAAVPVAPAVAGACELLGIDPMYVANEGVFVAIVEPGFAPPGFTDIGEVKTEPPGMVLVATSFGGKRVMDELVGDPLPEDLLMHELSIAAAIVRIACTHAGDRRIETVEVKVGHLRQVVPDSLAFAFTLVAEGTVAEGAELVLEVVPAAGVCRACGEESQLPGFPLACTACGSLDLELVRGEELLVDALTLKEGVPSGRS